MSSIDRLSTTLQETGTARHDALAVLIAAAAQIGSERFVVSMDGRRMWVLDIVDHDDVIVSLQHKIRELEHEVGTWKARADV